MEELAQRIEAAELAIQRAREGGLNVIDGKTTVYDAQLEATQALHVGDVAHPTPTPLQ